MKAVPFLSISSWLEFVTDLCAHIYTVSCAVAALSPFLLVSTLVFAFDVRSLCPDICDYWLSFHHHERADWKFFVRGQVLNVVSPRGIGRGPCQFEGIAPEVLT